MISKHKQLLLSKYDKKRYKFISSLFILLHVFGASWVTYYLIFNLKTYKINMNYTRQLLGFDYHNHKLNNIFKAWIISIQIRYIITDLYAFYKSLVNYKLLLYTVQIHGIESIICSIVFFLYKDKDYIIFGIVCSLWSLMWLIAYYNLHNLYIRRNKIM